MPETFGSRITKGRGKWDGPAHACPDRPDEIDIEGDGENKDIGDERVDCEERGVVEGLEVHRSVERMSGVKEVGANGNGNFGAAIVHGNLRGKVPIDGR